jgi:hypothetical protein
MKFADFQGQAFKYFGEYARIGKQARVKFSGTYNQRGTCSVRPLERPRWRVFRLYPHCRPARKTSGPPEIPCHDSNPQFPIWLTLKLRKDILNKYKPYYVMVTSTCFPVRKSCIPSYNYIEILKIGRKMSIGSNNKGWEVRGARCHEMGTFFHLPPRTSHDISRDEP